MCDLYSLTNGQSPIARIATSVERQPRVAGADAPASGSTSRKIGAFPEFGAAGAF
jgi:hypothetical protein